MIARRLQELACALAAGLCSAGLAAADASSADGRWRVEGRGAQVVVLDAGRTVKTLPARSLGGSENAAVTAVRFLPGRRSFVIAFDALPELWELSVDPDAPPLFEGLVHDWRMGEAIGSPGFLGVRRTRLDAPARSLELDPRGEAYVVAATAGAQLIVHLDVRRVIERRPAVSGHSDQPHQPGHGRSAERVVQHDQQRHAGAADACGQRAEQQ